MITIIGNRWLETPGGEKKLAACGLPRCAKQCLKRRFWCGKLRFIGRQLAFLVFHEYTESGHLGGKAGRDFSHKCEVVVVHREL